ncbi:hypothetical protein HYPSUDRAFT_49076 [Hypholoma sublateritium FD-334 SS-4]|uniref:Phytocyanin domain-containing protein n=1 Tax=Hypholoma sublateritium (strain FD-334 SS-4) TaxID=945553 RepID=A0A0D2ND36_HYPSF|nr:hypothetical protein HYPSUDRAFT_49076 [Hypholoma sublateritium FD-334 SS-4]
MRRVYVPAGAPEASLPTFSYAVSSANPVWFFCEPQDVCRKGVVFAINPPGDEAYYLFRSQAANASAGLSSAESTVSVSFSIPGARSTTGATTPSVSVAADSSSIVKPQK